ncbi:MAG TPA: DUF1801 domain-containing protein [Polyangia bacterium]
MPRLMKKTSKRPAAKQSTTKMTTKATKKPAKTKSAPKAQKPATVADYLRAQSADKRAALERLRKVIRSVAPKVEEAISYGIPGFRLNGKWLLWIGAGAEHCAIYGISGHAKELANYDTSGRGTLRFPPSEPPPPSLIQTLVKAAVARVTAKGAGRAKSSR